MVVGITGESSLLSKSCETKPHCADRGFDRTLLRHEFWLYIFDAVLMFLVMVMVNVRHPGVIKSELKNMSAARGDGRLGSQDVESLNGEVINLNSTQKA